MERIDFDKFFNMSFGEPVGAEGKGGKAPYSSGAEPQVISLELSLIAGQFIFQNNNADSGSTQLKWDAYQFQEQLLARLHIGDKLTFTVAPGFLSFNNASSGGTPWSARNDRAARGADRSNVRQRRNTRTILYPFRSPSVT